MSDQQRFLDLLSEGDRRQIADHGIDLAEICRQLALFADPPPPVRLDRPATVGDGIVRASDQQLAGWVERAEEEAAAGRITRFVPASGAASRMFAAPSAWLEEAEAALAAGAAGPGAIGEPPPEVARLLDELDRLPFSDRLASALADAGVATDAGRPISPGAVRGEAAVALLRFLLTDDGLGYAALPKGLIPFHRYADSGIDGDVDGDDGNGDDGDGGDRGCRTAFAEQLAESAELCADRDRICRLAFTVPPDARQRFDQELAAFAAGRPERFEVAFSYQRPATDTLAVDLDDRPFRLPDGRLLFRPGGHGALLGNLQAEAERHPGAAVLVKNIDNVLPAGRRGPVRRYQLALAGKLMALKGEIDRCLAALAAGEPGAPAAADEALGLVTGELGLALPPALADREPGDERLTAWLIDRLDRPLRVCGMVENRGEPGGGPFWVRSESAEHAPATLQIVEMAQIDERDPAQRAIVAAATHFNPVDLALAMHDRHGRPYRLERYADPATSFIAEKSEGGQPIKALERPGLWNGAMAGWNSLFLEVPAETFAPVKMVLDLLRPEHQPALGTQPQ